MKTYFPGTTVERNGENAEEFLMGIFSVTKGLMRAQVGEITGLDTPAIQNWINRGWVPKPVEKRYGAEHLARILIINMLRGVMKLEQIAQLLSYINGSPEQEPEQLITESQLYCCLCEILDRVDFETVLTDSALTSEIKKAIGKYKENCPNTKRLVNGIHMILVYYASSIVKRHADDMFNTVFQTGKTE